MGRDDPLWTVPPLGWFYSKAGWASYGGASYQAAFLHCLCLNSLLKFLILHPLRIDCNLSDAINSSLPRLLLAMGFYHSNRKQTKRNTHRVQKISILKTEFSYKKWYTVFIFLDLDCLSQCNISRKFYLYLQLNKVPLCICFTFFLPIHLIFSLLLIQQQGPWLKAIFVISTGVLWVSA